MDRGGLMELNYVAASMTKFRTKVTVVWGEVKTQRGKRGGGGGEKAGWMSTKDLAERDERSNAVELY